METFDRIAWCYDWFPVPTHAKVLRRALAGHGGLVVDLGGGTGKYTARIAAAQDRVLVVDRSARMLRRARRKRRLAAVRADASRVPLADDVADVVLCTEAFHHFADAQAAMLDEAARILRPDGLFLLEEPDPTTRSGRWMRHGEEAGHLGSRFHTPAALAAMVAERFADVRQEPSGRFTVLTVGRLPRPRDGRLPTPTL